MKNIRVTSEHKTLGLPVAENFVDQPSNLKPNMNAVLSFSTNGTGSCLSTELIALSSLGRPAKKHLTICLRGIESRNNRHEKYIAIGPRWIPFQRSGTPEFRPGPVSWVESPFAGRNHGQRAVRPGRARAGASTPDPTATAPNEPRSPTVARPWRIAVKPAAPHQSSSDGPMD